MIEAAMTAAIEHADCLCELIGGRRSGLLSMDEPLEEASRPRSTRGPGESALAATARMAQVLLCSSGPGPAQW
jgi:hypothetical protein